MFRRSYGAESYHSLVQKSHVDLTRAFRVLRVSADGILWDPVWINLLGITHARLLILSCYRRKPGRVEPHWPDKAAVS
jgi:hypothetical protein